MNSKKMMILLAMGFGACQGNDSVATIAEVPSEPTEETALALGEDDTFSVGPPLAGNLSVDNGAAQYSLPFDFPFDVTGPLPQLSLTYSSHAGDGPLGVGFRLAGLGHVTRCPRTRASDGFRRQVANDDLDAFCLNGMRLMEVSAAGAPTVRYLKEFDDFTEVTSTRTPTGDLVFTARTKDGLLYEYGGTPNSRRLAQSKGPTKVTVTSEWALSRVTNPRGQSYQVSYTTAQPGEELLVWRLGYGVNTEVLFSYADRPDVRTSYDPAGNALVRRKLLTSILSTIGTNTLWYTFKYEVSPQTNRQRLKSLTRCVSDPNLVGPGTCNAPLSFEYGANDPRVTRSFTGSVSSAYPILQTSVGNPLAGDFDKDGFSDIFIVGTPDSYFCSGKVISAGGACLKHNSDSWMKFYSPVAADFDGDGATDLILMRNKVSTTTSAFSGAFSTPFPGPYPNFFCAGDTLSTAGNRCTKMRDESISWATEFRHRTGDFDGDGFADLLLIGTPNTFLCVGGSQGSTTTDTIAVTNNCRIVDTSSWKTNYHSETVGDFDGDGKLDVFLHKANSSLACAFSFERPAEPTSRCNAVGTGWDVYGKYPGDFNGDGITDLLLAGNPGTSICLGPRVFESDAACRAHNNDAWGDGGKHALYVGDYDADGASDLLITKGYSGFGSSFGAAWFCTGRSLTDFPAETCRQIASVDTRLNRFYLQGDFNGDGSDDLQMVMTNSTPAGTAKIVSGIDGTPDLVTAFVTPGTRQEVKYLAGARMQATNQYTTSLSFALPRDANSVPPRRALVSTTTRVDESTVTPLRTTTTYRYDSAITELSTGRGFLGYRWTETVQPVELDAQGVPRAERRVRSSWGTQFPGQGLLLKEDIGVRALPSGAEVVVSSTTNEFKCVTSALTGPAAEGTGLLSMGNAGGCGRLPLKLPWATLLVGSTTIRNEYPATTIPPPGSKTETTYDRWGNPKVQLLTVLKPSFGGYASAGFTTRIEDVYAVTNPATAFPTSAFEQRRVRSTRTETTPTGSAVVTTVWDYDAAGDVVREVHEPTNSTLCQVTEWARDSAGLVLGTTQRACNGKAGSTPWNGEAPAPTGEVMAAPVSTTHSTSRDLVGNVVLGTVAPAVSTSTTRQLFRMTGATLALQDRSAGSSAGVSTITNTLGQPTKITNADGTVTTITRVACTTGCVFADDPARRYVRREVQTRPGRGSTTLYFDGFGRVTRSDRTTDGATTVTRFAFDALGQLRVAGTPVPKQAPLASLDLSTSGTQYLYDALGRERTAARPQDVRTTTYLGLTKTVSVAPRSGVGASPLTTQTFDHRGQLVRVVDAMNGATTYGYDALGRLTSTTGPTGLTSTSTFDVFGRTLTTSRPESGTTTNVYDVLGNLVRTTDAQGTTRFTYDALGRLLTEQRPDFFRKFTWASAGYFGQTTLGTCFAPADVPCTIYACQGGTCKEPGTPVSSTTPTGTSTLIHQKFNHLKGWLPTGSEVYVGNDRYTSGLSYDANFVLSALQYGTETVHVKMSESGAYRSLSSGPNETGTVYWRANTVDALQRPTLETLGNGVTEKTTFEPFTNRLARQEISLGATPHALLTYGYEGRDVVKSITDAATGMTSTFTHDALDRLRSETRAGGLVGIQSMTWSYDPAGNLSQVSSTVSGEDLTYAYAGGRLTGITGRVGMFSSPLYSYDARGRISEVTGILPVPLPATPGTTATRSIARKLTWLSFGLPSSMAFNPPDRTGTVTTTTLYSGNYDRLSETVTKGASSRTTRYPAPGYEVETDGVNQVSRLLLSNGRRTVAVVTIPTTGARTVRYLHQNGLGSTIAATTETGALAERLAYEPFGKRRYSNGVSDAWGLLTSTTTSVGFTGHEHLEDSALIHMNGRLYDPLIGRFLSPDFVQRSDSQGLNLYSYVRNSPLSFVDPSGFTEDSPSSAPSDPGDYGDYGYGLANPGPQSGSGSGRSSDPQLNAPETAGSCRPDVREANHIFNELRDRYNSGQPFSRDEWAQAAESFQWAYNLYEAARREQGLEPSPQMQMAMGGQISRAESFAGGTSSKGRELMATAALAMGLVGGPTGRPPKDGPFTQEQQSLMSIIYSYVTGIMSRADAKTYMELSEETGLSERSKPPRIDESSEQGRWRGAHLHSPGAKDHQVQIADAPFSDRTPAGYPLRNNFPTPTPSRKR